MFTGRERPLLRGTTGIGARCTARRSLGFTTHSTNDDGTALNGDAGAGRQRRSSRTKSGIDLVYS